MKCFKRILKLSMLVIALLILIPLTYTCAPLNCIRLEYREDAEYVARKNYVYMYLEPSFYNEIGFYSVTDLYKEPYRLFLTIYTDKNYEKKAELESVELKINGKSIFKSGQLENYSSPIDEDLRTMITYPLGANLKYVEGAILDVTAKMKMPHSDKTETVRRVFKSRKFEDTRPMIEVLLSN